MRFLALLALFVSAAAAGVITPINPSPFEPDLAQTLDLIYGSGNYTRVDDSLDRTWAPGDYTIRALSTYSYQSQSLGFCFLCDGTDNAFFDQVIWANGIFSIALTLGGSPTISPASAFTWIDYAVMGGITHTVYSDPALNPSGADQMVTFQIAGQPNTYLLAFEDWYLSDGADADYQDFLFEFSYLPSTPPSAIVPEPRAGFLLAGGLAVLFYFRRRK